MENKQHKSHEKELERATPTPPKDLETSAVDLVDVVNMIANPPLCSLCRD
jgi:hypothetical protein